MAEAKSKGVFDDGVVSLAAESITMVPGYPQCVHTDRGKAVQVDIRLLTLG